MLEILLIVLVVIILLGRPPAWTNTDPLGLLVSVLLVVILVALIFSAVGVYHWRY